MPHQSRNRTLLVAMSGSDTLGRYKLEQGTITRFRPRLGFLDLQNGERRPIVGQTIERFARQLATVDDSGIASAGSQNRRRFLKRAGKVTVGALAAVGLAGSVGVRQAGAWCSPSCTTCGGCGYVYWGCDCCTLSNPYTGCRYKAVACCSAGGQPLCACGATQDAGFSGCPGWIAHFGC